MQVIKYLARYHENKMHLMLDAYQFTFVLSDYITLYIDFPRLT